MLPAPKMSRLSWIVVSLAAAVVLYAWISGMTHVFFDHDENEHAHATWLVANGQRPYEDFFEVHPPFAWYVLSPLSDLLPDPFSFLITLRALSVIGSAAALALLILNLWTIRSDVPLVWTAAGVFLPAVVYSNVVFFSEFRIDSWPLAVLFAAFPLASADPRDRTFARMAVAAFLAACAIAISPKFVLLPVAYFGIDAVMQLRRGWRAAANTTIACAAGVSVAAIAAAVSLAFAGSSASTAFDLVARFHVQFGREANFGASLWSALQKEPLLLGFSIAGFICWVAMRAWRRTMPSPFELAVVVFLVAEAARVPFPYKQYYAPWFLLAATFTPWLFDALTLATPVVAPTAAEFALVVAVFYVGTSSAEYARFWQGVSDKREYLSSMNRLGVTRQHVVASVSRHPIDTFDTFYGLVVSDDRNGAVTAERVMLHLNVPASIHFTAASYARELERTHPVLIMPSSELTPTKELAIRDYLSRHAAEYEVRTVTGIKVWVLKKAGAR